ncbi:neurofilament heavy polypeptide [Apis mellifera carnica]|nr:neurofilament heavy polypeptide [Apis mellifera carnica]
MSRKKMVVVGRASLSFPTPDGILDVDQILDTDPWKQIDNFVQHNFRQNLLDEFNERLKLNPTIAPSESKSPAKKQGTTSSRTPRKSETTAAAAAKPKTNLGGKSAAKEKKSVDRSKPKLEPKGKKETAGNKTKDGGKEVSKGKENGGKEVSKGKENGGKEVSKGKEGGGGSVKGGGKKQAKENKCEKQASTGSMQKLNSVTRKNSMSRKRKENVVDVREKSIKGETTERKKDKVGGEGNKSSTNSVDESRSLISMSQLKTSTPKRGNLSVISSSVGKENVMARCNVSASKGDYSVRSDVSVKRMQCTSTSICATNHSSTDSNNNNGSKIEKKSKETSVAKLEHKSTILERTKEEGTLGGKEISRISMNEKKTLTLSCKKQDKKEASAEKKIGKYEKRLLERRERRRKRNIKRHERKAEQAMEEFSHHVTRIVKKMGYLSEFSSCSSSEDDVSSYSDYSYDTYSESSKGSIVLLLFLLFS